MGRHRGSRTGAEDRVRHVRGHVDERGRQPRRHARSCFDLLGDIYTMPIGGSGPSAATRITSGPAFDMQPRFSPDGKRIAFASDRDGLWNIWTMDAGREEREAGLAREALVHQQPGVVARRQLHLRAPPLRRRSGRSAPARSGCSTPPGPTACRSPRRTASRRTPASRRCRPTAATSITARTSRPASTSNTTRIPNGTIYAIIRRDLNTGRERTAVSVQGGSVTPRVSPDGKSLALRPPRAARQASCTSAISQTGRDRAVFDHLDKDLQEAWAIHGLYPQYAWTPDGKSIVIWGEGKIWRVDVADGEGRRVAVHRARRADGERGACASRRKSTRRSSRSRRCATSPSRPTASASPTARSATSTSRTCSGGEPKRVTDERARFEFAPKWSRRRAVDRPHDVDRRGLRPRPRRASRRHRRARRRHDARALHRAGVLAATANGSCSATRAGRHRAARSTAASAGIYVVPTDGSAAPRLVREGGIEPSFDSTGRRVFVNDFRQGKAVLVSVGIGDPRLAALGRRRHRPLPVRQRARRSCRRPDGKWVAFAERWHAFVAPFPRTGRPIDLGPDDRRAIRRRASRGTPASTSTGRATAAQVYWVDGAGALHARSARRPSRSSTPASRSRTSRKRRARTSASRAKSRRARRRDRASSARRIITAVAATPYRERHGRRRRQPHHRRRPRRRAIPAGAKRDRRRAARRSCRASSTSTATSAAKETASSRRRAGRSMANLAFGVTTTHDPSNDTETVFSNAELIRAGTKLGPRLFSTGTILYGAETPFKADRRRTTTTRCRHCGGRRRSARSA